MKEFELVWDIRCELGETPVWDAARRRLLFADIYSGRIHRYSLAAPERPDGHWTLPDIVPSFGMCRSGRLVAAQRHDVILFDPCTGQLHTLAEAVEPDARARLNDGKVGPDGCFWVGSMDARPDKEAIGALYRVTPEGRVDKKVDGFQIFNGLAWTADGSVMVHACTKSAVIDAWDFDKHSGALSNRRRMATLSADVGRPDGGAFDAEGAYWSAGVSAGRINRFSLTGELLEHHRFPVPAPSMPCFVGSDLYVTSLYEHREALRAEYPTLGGLFRKRLPVRGAPIGCFADDGF